MNKTMAATNEVPKPYLIAEAAQGTERGRVKPGRSLSLILSDEEA